MKVYGQQMKKLNNPKYAKDKTDIVESEGKLQQLGYVDSVINLSLNLQSKLLHHQAQSYNPWRAVWKGNSVSTPCRIVFEASQATLSGYSLDILAIGKNNLNKLQEIITHWSINRLALHSDVWKMYNNMYNHSTKGRRLVFSKLCLARSTRPNKNP